jgi:opacity protein-like surface antigen
MKYLLAGIIGLFALAAVNAAHAQPPGVSTAYSWTGCYVGVNGGYGWNKGNSSYQDSNSTADPINFIPATRQYLSAPGRCSLICPTPSETCRIGVLGRRTDRLVTGKLSEPTTGWSALKATSRTWTPIFPEQCNTPENSGAGQFQIGPSTFGRRSCRLQHQRSSRFRCK